MKKEIKNDRRISIRNEPNGFLEEIEQLKIDIRIMYLNRWLWILIYVLLFSGVAYITGYYNGLIDGLSLFEISNINELLNVTKNTSSEQLIEIYLK